MFGGWKVKAATLKATCLVAGHQLAKEMPAPLQMILDIFAAAARSGDGQAFAEMRAKLDALPVLSDAERPIHEPASINGWDIQAMFVTKNGELWWVVHAIRKDEQVPSDKDMELLYHVLEVLGGTPADAVIAPLSSPFTQNLPFGWWTWRNVSPLMEMQFKPEGKGKEITRVVRFGAPETDGYIRFSNEDRAAYELVNVVERAAKHPSFEIPTRHHREGLHKGDLAKLIFRRPAIAGDEFVGERMWVCVTHRTHYGRYVGELANHPTTVALKHGARIFFGPEHVCDWETGPA